MSPGYISGLWRPKNRVRFGKQKKRRHCGNSIVQANYSKKG